MRTLASVVWVAFFIGSAPAQAVGTPQPDGARSIEIAPVVRMNGRPVGLRQFVVAQPLDAVLAFYRHEFGEHRVEPALAGHRVVAALRDKVFVTVRLTAASATHTSALVLESPVAAANASLPDALSARWPTGSRVLSDLEFDDAGRRSRVVVVDNAHASELNVDILRAIARDRALEEQRDKAVVGADGVVSRTLWFGGASGEAIAVITDKGERRMVVLALIGRLESR